jgi:hypothetical protein
VADAKKTWPRRPVVWIVAAAVVAGVAAYLFYFNWSQPLLDGGRIAAYAYGRQETNPLEFERHERAGDPTLERLLTLIDEAKLTRTEMRRDPKGLLVILYRDDGLQYRLILDGPRAAGSWGVGISEGDQSYLGSLDQPELVALLRGLQAKVP